MPTNNPIVAALPSAGDADHALLRSWAVSRNAYCLSSDEDSRDLVAIDPGGGGTVPALIQNGLLYGLDPDDSTTAHDGVLCLVSYDSQRYKLEAGLHAPFNVLDKDLTAPPTSPAPSYGDSYLIYGSPTGAWAGKSGYIAIYTARGWEFSLPPLGFLVYVRDESSFYHRNNLGAWTLGTGTRTLGDNSVAVSNIIGKVVRFNVLNQTTLSPPLSPAPSIGDQYIIGPSAIGSWSGLDGRIAICEDGATFTVYQARNGWLAFDQNLGVDVRFNGTSWASAAGAVQQSGYTVNTSNTSSTPVGTSNTGYVYSNTSGPNGTSHVIAETITIQAPNSSAKIEVEFEARLDSAALTTTSTIAILRDSETAALDWWPVISTLATQVIRAKFIISAVDALSHTYSIAHYRGVNSDTHGNFQRRQTSWKVLV